eukprot:3842577-Prymnesium_polylepis.1
MGTASSNRAHSASQKQASNRAPHSLHISVPLSRCAADLFIDTRDTFFQANVFAARASWWDDAFVVGLESELGYDTQGTPVETISFGRPKAYNIQ